MYSNLRFRTDNSFLKIKYIFGKNVLSLYIYVEDADPLVQRKVLGTLIHYLNLYDNIYYKLLITHDFMLDAVNIFSYKRPL